MEVSKSEDRALAWLKKSVRTAHIAFKRQILGNRRVLLVHQLGNKNVLIFQKFSSPWIDLGEDLDPTPSAKTTLPGSINLAVPRFLQTRLLHKPC